MTTPNHPTHSSAMPYQRYLTATHAARDQYLATTYTAHRMYLTGPWPDRETYQQVENTAWKVYYAAARDAWQRYTAETTAPPPPPARSNEYHPTRDAAGEVWPADPPRPDEHISGPCGVCGRTDQHWHYPDQSGVPSPQPKGDQ